MRNYSIQKGFTLIELLAVLGILAVLTAVSIASFSAYNTTQVIDSSAADVSSLLYTARSKAIDRVKPEECFTQTLVGYQVSLTIPSQYELSAICETSTYLIEQRNLPGNVAFRQGSSTNILFKALSGSIDGSAQVVLTGNNSYELITVDSIGAISRSSVSVPPSPLPTPTAAIVTVTPTPRQTENVSAPTPTAAACSKNYSCMFFLGCFRTVTGTGKYCSSSCENAC